MPPNNGYVYCLSNASFGNSVYKIGFTTKHPEERAQQLYNTGVPTPFRVEESVYVHDYRQKEKTIHQLLDAHRINSGREFFNIPIHKVQQLFSLMKTGQKKVASCKRKWSDVEVSETNTNRQLHPKLKHKTNVYLRKSLSRKAKRNIVYSK